MVRNSQDQIAAALARGSYHEAYGELRNLWREQAGSASAGYVLTQVKQLRGQISLVAQRIAILRSFTVEPVVPIFRADALMNGVDATVHIGTFNSHAQEILDPEDPLYRFDPDVVILAVQTRDAAPEIWQWEHENAGRAAVARVLGEYRNLIKVFRSRHNANFVIHDFEQPVHPRHGILDAQSSSGQAATISELNRGLREIAAEIPGVSILGYDALIATHGRVRWFDHRKWLTARLPISADCLVHLGAEWSRYVSCLAGRLSKVIVTDLDNTLWGGIVGEDGPNGVAVGKEYPGAAYTELHEALLACRERGILLAIASKNNWNDALEVLEHHPHMLLRPGHFAAMRINWNSKAQSIREIASELNVGIDSIAFLDDNPVERERVKLELPEVTVLEFSDPLQFASQVRGHAGFQRIALLNEDKDRSQYYAERTQRQQAASSAASLEDFYRSLQQRVEIRPVDASTLARAAQITQKTNQFNLTTKRYTEQNIAHLAATPGWTIYGVNVQDRFGDNGLVGVVVLRRRDHSMEIDTFALSCRVIGRKVETAILAFLTEEARVAECSEIRGWFVPTKKNGPAAGFFAGHGFSLMGEHNGESEWKLDLHAATLDCPEWIQLSGRDPQLRESARI